MLMDDGLPSAARTWHNRRNQTCMERTKEQLMIQEVLTEAWNNPGFKADLLTDPLTAIQQLTGLELHLPPGKTLAVVDQSDNDIIWLQIPPQPDSSQLH